MIEIADLHIEKGDKETVEYIRDNHYTGTCCPACNQWDLMYDDERVGAIVFANPMSEKVREFIAGNDEKKSVTELHRLYTDDRCGKNVESWFIARGLNRLKDHKPKYRFVVSYADTTEGHTGTIYKATNALYTGQANERKFYRDNDGNLRAPRESGNNVTHSEAKERGWNIEKRMTKHRYVFPLPDEYESRNDVIEDMKCEQYEYPE